MTKNTIAVCDWDEDYVASFSSYLMEHIPNIKIHSFTSEEAFLESEQSFTIGILNQDFLRVLEFGGKELVQEKLYLCDENIVTEYEHLPMVYKYQSMEIVEEMIRRMLQKKTGTWWRNQKELATSMIGIYSPISHELSMPFALSLCQILREKGKVLFLDIEEMSMMNYFIDHRNAKSMMDLFYMIVQKEEPHLEEYVNTFMGVDYLCPFVNPEEVNDITKEDWNCLMQCVLSAGYEKVVILFGRTVQGFRSMISLCEELYVLGKPGDYYQKTQRSFLEYASKTFSNIHLQSVLLPMSASNLVDGTYMMEELIQGNLGMFVRKMMQERQLQQERQYAVS